jgi:alpha-N-arabinofuranosidase
MKNLMRPDRLAALQPHRRIPMWGVLLVLAFVLRIPAFAQTDMSIYDDSLENSWQNWSWATVDLASTAIVHSGSDSIAVTAGPWTALSLQHDPIDSTGYGNVTFWINGGPTGGQILNVIGTLSHNAQSGVVIGPLAANTWQQVTVPLASMGVANSTSFTGFWIQEWTGNAQPTFYVDDVVLTGSVPVTPPPPLSGMAIYGDSFVSGWQNWSWASVNPANTTPVNSGTSSIAVTSGPYTALSFHHNAMNTSMYSTLTFWINGGSTGGQVLKLSALLSGAAQPGTVLPPLAPNTWTKMSIPLADLGVAGHPDLTDIWFQEDAGINQPTYYVDDVRLDFAPTPSVVNVAVDNGHALQIVDPRLFGVNTAVWDGSFNTPTTTGLLQEIHNRALRFPGGSLADVYFWQTNMSQGQTFQWATNFDAFAAIATATHAQVYITTNYGSDTPEDAAAWVLYSNRTKRYGFKYWEIGNENYGSWEADDNTRPHDPVTYATRFKQYWQQMKAVDPTIRIGAVITADEDSYANYTDETVTNPRTGLTHNGWSAVMLSTFKKMHLTPDFVIYHRYEQNAGGESDPFLLTAAATWGNDAAAIRQLLNDYLGRDARRVEIDCTENNSISSGPGKQTTSLVNGLYLADSLANIMKTEFRSLLWWDLRNGQDNTNNNSPLLYGWRNYGDYGIVDSNTPAAPADRYPTFYVDKLMRKFARGGDKVIGATSDYIGLGAYAVRDRRDHSLNLLLINKHPTDTLNATVTLSEFKAGAMADVYSYGIPQDTAAQTGVGTADIVQSTLALTGNTFTYSPAPYSATVIRIHHAKKHEDHDHRDH